jgi:hypothetical protein
MDEMNPIPKDLGAQIQEEEKEVDLNALFPDEGNDLNQLFPEAEMKDLLKKVSKNKKDLHLMVDRFTEISDD